MQRKEKALTSSGYSSVVIQTLPEVSESPIIPYQTQYDEASHQGFASDFFVHRPMGGMTKPVHKVHCVRS